MKAIIIYYSRSGNTEKLAKRIQSDLSCDILKIEPEAAYGNYISSCIRATREKMAALPPKFLTPIPDLRRYDVVLLGFPIWMQDLPRLVSDFISRCDLSRKTLIPFATFGMTGLSWTEKTLSRVCPDVKRVLPLNWGILKKDDYNCWLNDVKKLQINAGGIYK